MANRRGHQPETQRESWWSLGLKAAAGLGVLSASAVLATEAYKVSKERNRQQQVQEQAQRPSDQVPSTSMQTESASEEEDAETMKEKFQGSVACEWSDYEEVDSDDYEEAVEHAGKERRGGGSGSAELQGSGLPLMTRLESYYTSYVVTNEERQHMEREVVRNFLAFFMKYVRQHGNNLPIRNAFFAGDRSQVTIVKAYDVSTKLVVVPIDMNPNTWEYVDSRHSVIRMPGYFLVRRINLDFIPKGQDPWDPFMVGHYLCPGYVLRHLQNLLGSSIEEYCKMTSANAPSLAVEAKIYATLGTTRVTLTSSPYSQRTPIRDEEITNSEEEDNTAGHLRPDANLWMWCFNEFVLEMLHDRDSIGSGPGGCRMKCLAIMEALRVNNSKLQVLSHGHLLAVMYMACAEETEWESHMLAERFFDVLVILTRCMSRHSLPHPRDASVNYFLDTPSWALQRALKWLQSIIKNPRKIAGMLKHKY